MIPDKIYIRPQTNPNMLGGLWSGKQTKEATVPYIRKDALMEMLKGYSHPITRVVVQELIDKINEL